MSNKQIQQSSPKKEDNLQKQNERQIQKQVNANDGAPQCQQQSPNKSLSHIEGDEQKNKPDQQNKDLQDNQNNQDKDQADISPQVVEFLEVANYRRQNQKMGNKEQFLKIFQQINEKEAELENEAKMLERKKSTKKKLSQFQGSKDAKNLSEQNKKQKILKQIQPAIIKYKAMYCPNFSDTQVAKLRFDGKQKIFKYILFLSEQIKHIDDDTKITDQQQRLKQMSREQIIKLAKTISNEIDVQFLNQLNSGNKQFSSKKYKSHWRNLTSNLQDDNNYDLRRKVATRIWSAKKLVGADQTQFYPSEKLELIRQKNKRLMNEATIQDKNAGVVQQQQDGITYSNKEIWSTNKISIAQQDRQKNKKPGYKYLDEGSLLLIRDLISNQQIMRMKKLLSQDLKGQVKQKLISSINQVFQDI